MNYFIVTYTIFSHRKVFANGTMGVCAPDENFSQETVKLRLSEDFPVENINITTSVVTCTMNEYLSQELKLSF